MEWRHEVVEVPGLGSDVAGVCPSTSHDRNRWWFVTCDGRLLGVDLDEGASFQELGVGLTFERPGAADVVSSGDGRFVAVVPQRGTAGVLCDLETSVLTPLRREDYHADVSGWAVAIVRHEGRDVLVHATAWNRLEAWALPSLERLAPAEPESSLDYFWGTMAPSPSGQRLASFGWIWHPVGALRVVDVPAWLTGREDPPPGPTGPLAEWWDEPVAWLGETRLALIGQPGEDEVGEQAYLSGRDGLFVVDLSAGATRFVPGLAARAFGFDGGRLILLGDDTVAVDRDSLEVVARSSRPSDVWHAGARLALACPGLRGASGPCELSWLTGTLGHHPELIRGVTTPSPVALAVLGDALEERALALEAVAHCRAGEAHGRRCWAVEGLR